MVENEVDERGFWNGLIVIRARVYRIYRDVHVVYTACFSKIVLYIATYEFFNKSLFIHKQHNTLKIMLFLINTLLLGTSLLTLTNAEPTTPTETVTASQNALLGDPLAPRLVYDSLAEGFKISLVRPPGERKNSGVKSLVNMSSTVMLEDEEIKTLDDYDELFEKYSMFCNGRWLGVQILQDSQDLMYLQHISYMRKPDIIIETGTYKGGLTFFFAHILDVVEREESFEGKQKRNTAVISVDRHHPELVFAANWFCPVCADCRRAHETREWAE